MAKGLAVLRVIGWREDTLQTCWLNHFFGWHKLNMAGAGVSLFCESCNESRTSHISVPACRSAVILANALHPRHASRMSRRFVAVIGMAGLL